MSVKAKRIKGTRRSPESMSCDGCPVRGDCCKWIAVPLEGTTPELFSWAVCRGLRIEPEQGYILIPHTCAHLDGQLCNDYEHRPDICRKWVGQKQIKGQKFWIPPGYILRKK